ncbi:MAG: 3-methylcrotonyl-CoA carboxylase, partial [Hyphomicrobiaceae bacterium]|nr:3-methylcrotonyl-CoA carboxylase [Hyphomicrobiaceae bacterium]
MTNTILIANRGEIACRIIRSVQSLGLKAVAVHSDADATARHVRMADSTVHIGPSRAADSYLDAGRILEAAKESGAG